MTDTAGHGDCGSALACPRAQLAEFTHGSLAPAADLRAPAAVCKHSRVFPATPRQVREARAYLATALRDCPIVDDAVLCLSELASNAVLHSDSRKPGGTFTVRVEVHDSDYVWIEVEDNGGAWQEPTRRDGRPHGLEIIRQLTADSGKDGDSLTGWVMWAQLDWSAPAARRAIPPPPQR
jgi:anti-sigma regulatory factor (Ser/Thr protein kinase)